MRHDNNSVDEEEKESLDYEATKEMVNLIVRAPLRRPKLAAAIFLLLTALGILAALFVTPLYTASEVLVITRNVITPNIGQQNAPPQEYDPTAGIWEAVKGRDSLVKLAQQTHLADKIRAPGEGPPLTEDGKLQLAVKTLEYRLNIKPDGNTVAFVAEWTDAQTAYDLARGAVLNFLETRKADEISKISEAINLVEKSAQDERDGIDQALQDFIKLKMGWSPGSSSGAAASTSPGAPAPVAPVGAAPAATPSVRPMAAGGPDVDLAKRLEDKKQQIRQTEEEWHRAQTEATARLNDLLVKFTPSHPSVIAQQSQADRLSEEPGNLKALKSEERSLIRELEAQMSLKGDRPAPRPGGPIYIPPSLGTSRTPISKQDLEVSDPQSAMALEALQSRAHKFNEYADQVSAMRLQLELARKAFETRYRAFKPAELPTKPKYPVRVILVWGGALLGLFLSIGVAAALDLASGRFIEPWQVKRRLALPVLGEVAGP
jgi:capsular polysaccharide biosynthesis protein